MEAISILIVEDTPDDMLLIKEQLSTNQKVPPVIKEAETLQAAKRILQHYDIDVVLLDPGLPDSSSLDTIRNIHNTAPDAAIILLTGPGDEESASQAFRYGAQDYLDKSHLSPVTLSRAIHYSLERMKVMQDKTDLLQDLSDALHRVDLLEKLLPLCVGCKKILGNDNAWYTIDDTYTLSISEEKGDVICPDCQTKLDES